MKTLTSAHAPQPSITLCFNAIFFQLYFHNAHNRAVPLFALTDHLTKLCLNNMHRNLLENDNLEDKEGKTKDPVEKGSRDRRRMELVQDRVR